jgi:hypothetical protein
MVRHALGVAAGGGGLVSALLAGGWIGVVLMAVVVLALVVAVCWVVADADRPARLALLITSWRAGTPARTARAATPRKARQVSGPTPPTSSQDLRAAETTAPTNTSVG